MPAAVPGIIIIAVILILAAAVFLPIREQAVPVDPLADAPTEKLPIVRCHAAPLNGYTIFEAHQAWQDLMFCDRKVCDAKHTALTVLAQHKKVRFVESGR